MGWLDGTQVKHELSPHLLGREIFHFTPTLTHEFCTYLLLAPLLFFLVAQLSHDRLPPPL